MWEYNVTWLSDGYVVNGTKMYSYNFSTISIKNVLITNYKLKMFINSVIQFNIFYQEIVYKKVV